MQSSPWQCVDARGSPLGHVSISLQHSQLYTITSIAEDELGEIIMLLEPLFETRWLCMLHNSSRKKIQIRACPPPSVWLHFPFFFLAHAGTEHVDACITKSLSSRLPFFNAFWNKNKLLVQPLERLLLLYGLLCTVVKLAYVNLYSPFICIFCNWWNKCISCFSAWRCRTSVNIKHTNQRSASFFIEFVRPLPALLASTQPPL